MLLRLLLRLNNLKLNNLNPLHLNPLRSTSAMVVAIAAVIVGAIGARATSIDGWNYDPASGQLKFEVADGVKPRHFLMAQPARIVVDLQDTQVGNALAETSYASGPVKKITVDQLQPGLVRVTLFMAADAVFLKGQVAIDRVGDGLRSVSDVWSVRPLLAGMSTTGTAENPSGVVVSGNEVVSGNAIVPVIPSVSPISGETNLPGRFNQSSEPAVVPTVGELPPGMTSVMLSARVKPVATKPVATKPAEIKPAEIKPAEIKAPAKPVSEVIPIAVPQLVLVNPVEIKPAVNLPVVTKLETAGTIATRPSDLLQTTPAVLEVPAMAMPPITVPSLEMGLPKGEHLKVQGNSSSVVSAMPIPDGIPAIVPGVGSGVPTVSVPPLGSLWVTPAAVPSVIPSGLPSAMPNVIPSVMPAAMPNVLPAMTPNVGVMPLPDRVPSIVPTVPRVSPMQSLSPLVSPVMQPQTQVVQTENYRPSGSGVQAVERQAIANSPASVVPGLIQFGQPLGETGGVTSLPPEMPPVLTNGVNLSVNNGLMLPIGTVLKVRYTGISSVAVKNGEARHEMLVLQTTIRDRSGLVIAPEGTTIYGRFEGGAMNNRFVASAIAIQGQRVALVAESGDLGGSRNPKQGSLLQNSGIGALAGIIIGGLTGGNVIGGAAAGAAITYATTPKVTAVQPGQVLEIRLTQDWVLPGGLAMDDRSGVADPISRGF